jgi:formate C-acetyltransferase
MAIATDCVQPKYAIKKPANLSPRIQWLRDYYFEGVRRKWNNEYTAWTTGTHWDFQYEEIPFYIVPETFTFFTTFRSAYRQIARPIKLDPEFWKWSLPERKAWFTRQVMVNYLPHEILPGDLIAGARFNIQASTCLTESEAKQYVKLVHGKNGARAAAQWLHNHGYGNAGATSGHLVPDYARIIRSGWKDVHAELEQRLAALSEAEKKGRKGAQLRAMLSGDHSA